MHYDASPERNRKKALLITLGIHLLLAFALFLGVQWKTERAASVEVALWDMPIAPPTPPAVTPPVQRHPEPPQPIKPAKPVIALTPDKKEPPPPKEKPKEPVKPEKPVHDEYLRELLAQEERASRQNMANAELAARHGAAQREAARNKWIEKIQNKVKGNVILPPNIIGNPPAEFYVRLLPTGDLVDVRLLRSSGNVALDEAAERAIWKSKPLPLPDDMSVFVPVISPLRYYPYD